MQRTRATSIVSVNSDTSQGKDKTMVEEIMMTVLAVSVICMLAFMPHHLNELNELRMEEIESVEEGEL